MVTDLRTINNVIQTMGCRMVTDLRAINNVIQTMGPLQSKIPLSSLLPKGWTLIVTDLKDCFFAIPLLEKDKENFAFSVPTYNNS